MDLTLRQKVFRFLLMLAVFAALLAPAAAAASTPNPQPVKSLEYKVAAYLPQLYRDPDVPTLAEPKNGSRVSILIPNFIWNMGSLPENTYACLAVGTRPHPTTCSEAMLAVSNFANHARLTYNLAQNTTYYWRVATIYNENYSRKYWSAEYHFTIGTTSGVILPAPMLLAPANNSQLTANDVKFSWKPVTGTTYYRVVLYSLDQKRRITFPLTTGTEVTLNNVPLFCELYGYNYQWYVVSRNNYAWGAKSTLWNFAYTTHTTDVDSIPRPGFSFTFAPESP